MTADSPAVVASFTPQLEQAREAFLSAGQVEGQSTPREEQVVVPYPLLGLAEVLRFPPLKWIVKDLIPDVGIGQFWGASTSGKSFLTLDLGIHVAKGRTWYDHRTQKRPVVLLYLEGQGGARKRIEAYQVFHGEPLPENMLIGVTPTTLYKPEDIDAIAAAIPEAALVIVDTQSCATVGLGENNTEDMGLFIDAAKRLSVAKRSFILFVHHAGKDSGRGARGSSVQLPSWDFAAEVVREGQSRFWRAVKVKDGGGEGEKHSFRLGIVDLGRDEDEDPITSCVALPDLGCEQDKKTLTDNQRYTLESLHIVLEEMGIASVHLEDWRPVFYAGHTADKPDTKCRAFERGRKELVNRGLIFVTNDYYSTREIGGHGQKPDISRTSLSAQSTKQPDGHGQGSSDPVRLSGKGDGEPEYE